MVGLVLDTGYRYNKCREFCGFCINYVNMQSGEVTERVLGYLETPRKSGLHLMEATERMVKAFNARTESLIKHIGSGNVPRCGAFFEIYRQSSS